MKIFKFFAAICMLGFMACSGGDTVDEEKKPEAPVNNDDWQKVPASGGEVHKDDVSIIIPSGTFSGETKIAIADLPSGEVGGDHEISKFHEITMPINSKQPIKVSIKSNERGDDVYFVIRSWSYARSRFSQTVDIVSYKGEYADGEYKLTLPAVENGSDGKNINFAIGLAHVQRWDSDMPSTRAEKGTIKWHFDLNYAPDGHFTMFGKELPYPDFKNFGLFWMTGEKYNKYVAQKKLINGYIREAIDKIHDMGYQIATDRDIPYIFTTGLGKEVYGQFCQSPWDDKKSTIKLNLEMIVNGIDEVTLKQTVMHETMHYFQAEYDNRPSWDKAGKAYDELMMYESGAVWSEKLMNNNKLNADFIQQYLPYFVRGLSDIDGIYEKDASSQDYIAYQNHGYAMAILLEYMAKNMKLSSTAELYEIWKKDKNKTLENLKAWAAKHNYKLFEGDNYDQFIYSLLRGELLSDVGPVQMSENAKAEVFTDSRVCDDEVRSCFPYGCAIGKYRFNNFTKEALMGKKLIVTQKSKDCQTSLYFVGAKKELIECKITAGDSIVIDGSNLAKYWISANNSINLFTINTNKTNNKTHQSKVIVELRDTEESDVKITSFTSIYFSCHLNSKIKRNNMDLSTNFGFYSDYYKDKTFTVSQSKETVHVESSHKTQNSADKGEKSETQINISFDITGFTGNFANCKIENLKYSSSDDYTYPRDWDVSDVSRDVDNITCTLTDIPAETTNFFPNVRDKDGSTYSMGSFSFNANGKDAFKVVDFEHKDTSYDKKGNPIVDEYVLTPSADDKIEFSITFNYSSKKK